MRTRDGRQKAPRSLQRVGATTTAQLIGVQFDRQTVGRRRFEYFRDLCGAEREVLNIRVDGISQVEFGDRRKQFAADKVDVSVNIILEFGRNGVCR